jgi:hypothetical protein
MLAVHHYHLSHHLMPPMTVTERPFANNVTARVSGMDLDKPLKDFATNFNNYVTEQNSSWRELNLASFWGYVVAALTAIFSFCQELILNNKRRDVRQTYQTQYAPQIGFGISTDDDNHKPDQKSEGTNKKETEI